MMSYHLFRTPTSNILQIDVIILEAMPLSCHIEESGIDIQLKILMQSLVALVCVWMYQVLNF